MLCSPNPGVVVHRNTSLPHTVCRPNKTEAAEALDTLAAHVSELSEADSLAAHRMRKVLGVLSKVVTTAY